jgi:hypothetical protein
MDTIEGIAGADVSPHIRNHRKGIFLITKTFENSIRSRNDITGNLRKVRAFFQIIEAVPGAQSLDIGFMNSLRITFNGAKFYPIEVENIIDTYPELQEVVVFGRADKRFGEVAAAAIVSAEKLNPAEIVEFCQGKMEQYKIPRFYFRVNEIPRNDNGKVIYAELEKLLEDQIKNMETA